MENGVDALEAEREVRPESDLEVDGDNGDLKTSMDEAKDSEENDVFEEAIEPPTPYADAGSYVQQHVVATVVGGVEVTDVEGDGGLEGLEEGKFVESVDVQLNQRSPEDNNEVAVSENFNETPELLIDVLNHGYVVTTDPSVLDKDSLEDAQDFGDVDVVVKRDKATDTLENGQGLAKVGAQVKLDEETGGVEDVQTFEEVKMVVVAQIEDMDIKELNASGSEKQLEAPDQPGYAINGETRNESISPELTDMKVEHTVTEELGSVANGSSILTIDDRELSSGEGTVESGHQKIDTKDLDEGNSKGSRVTLSDAAESTPSVEVTTNDSDAMDGGLQQDRGNRMGGNVVDPLDHSKELEKSLQSDQNPSKMDNTQIEAGSHASNGTTNNTNMKESQTSGPGNKDKVTEDVQNKPVPLEKLAGKKFIGDDNTNRQKELPSTSHTENSRAPGLPSRPAGLGSSTTLLEPSGRSLQQPRANGSVSERSSLSSDEPSNDDAEENNETREKLQMIRVKFLRLACRLGQTPHNVVVAQVLYRLGLAEQLRRNTNRPGVFSYDQASVMAEQLEAAGHEPLDFSCTIMVIGKTGVGKSATINSIFDEVRLPTNAFNHSTKKVQEIVGTVQGIKLKVIDTPGLSSSSSDQRRNEKILHSVKKFINKSPPDIVLYFDRLDMQSRDYGDIPLLRTITDIFGSSIWFNAIVVLTHAASAPPDGPNGNPLSYEMFVTQRSHVVQQAIRQAAGDVRLMNPVSLVENHSACRMNRAGQRVLPNGQVWKPQLLLLSFASKILAEANMLLKLQDSPPGKPFGTRLRVPPLPAFLSSLLQSKPQLKLTGEQFDDDDTLDGDLDETSDSEEGSEYDELPPFKPLSKSQLAKLSKAQKRAYFEELEYREKLFYKKQLKEEKLRRKYLKKMAEMAKDLPDGYNNENPEDEGSGPASVPVPVPDFVLPNSFDSDYPSHRYRFLDSSSRWIVRPVLDSQGWDHDIGYEGLNVERLFVVKDKVPISVSGQFTKDKKECNLQMEVASSIKHGERKATSLGLDLQTVGKDMAYTLRGETRFKNFRRNNTAAGVSVTFLADSMSAGLKIEDKLTIGKRFKILMSGGAMTGRGDVAYGGRLEVTLKDKDYPIGRYLSTLALSVMDWHGDLALGCNVQSQIPVGRGTNIIGHANLSNKGTAQVGIRLNSSEHLQIAFLVLVPILRNVNRMLFGSQSI